MGIAFKDAALSRQFHEKQKLRMAKKSGYVEAAESGAAVIVINQLGCEIAVDLGQSFRVVEEREKTDMG